VLAVLFRYFLCKVLREARQTNLISPMIAEWLPMIGEFYKDIPDAKKKYWAKESQKYDLYPNGFSIDRFVEVLDNNYVWAYLDYDFPEKDSTEDLNVYECIQIIDSIS